MVVNEFKVGDLVTVIDSDTKILPLGSEHIVYYNLGVFLGLEKSDSTSGWLKTRFVKGQLTRLERIIYDIE